MTPYTFLFTFRNGPTPFEYVQIENIETLGIDRAMTTHGSAYC